MARVSRQALKLIAELREDPEVNKTELAQVLAVRGKVLGLHDALLIEDLWTSFDLDKVQGDDPFEPYRLGMYGYTSEVYPQIESYMACPARLWGPDACLGCTPGLLVPCYLDNEDLLNKDKEVATSILEKTQLNSKLRKYGYPSRVILKITDISLVREILELSDKADISTPTGEAETKAIWDGIDGDLRGTALETKVREILASLTTKEEVEPEKPAPKKRASRKKPVKQVAEAAEDKGEVEKETAAPVKKTRAKKAATVDLGPIQEHVNSLRISLAGLTESVAATAECVRRVEGTDALLLARVARLESIVEVTCNFVSKGMCLIIGDDEIFAKELEQMEKLTAPRTGPPDDLTDLGNSDLADLCAVQNAPDSVLESREAMIGWIRGSTV